MSGISNFIPLPRNGKSKKADGNFRAHIFEIRAN